MRRLIGIDLGTTNSVVAVYDRGKPRIIPNALHQYLTPSVVRFLKSGETVVGQRAFDYRLVDPRHTITGVKRYIGRTYNEIADLAEFAPFEVLPGTENNAVIRVRDREYTPEHISSLILRELKASAEAYLGESVDEAVVTVPAYFSQPQRAATARAVELAGLDLKRLIAEPSAAGFGYPAAYREREEERVVVVVDLGGGTYDVTVAEFGYRVVEVCAIRGDNHLGGDDFDRVLAEWVLETIRYDHGIEPRDHPDVQARVFEESRQLRHDLSVRQESILRLPHLYRQAGHFVDVELPVSRLLFEDIADELFTRLVGPLRAALADAGRRAKDVSEVLLVGGATRMTRIEAIVRDVFAKAPRRGVSPDEAVALGAALQAGVLEGRVRDSLLLDATRLSLSVEIGN